MAGSAGEDDFSDDIMTNKKEGESEVGRVAMRVNLLEGASVSPIKEQEKKRPRRDGEGRDGELTNPNAKSTLSLEESDRAQ